MKEFNFIEKKTLNFSEKEAIRLLWNREYPKSIQQNTLTDFDDYLTKLNDKNHILVVKDDTIIGWYCDFVRNSERWFAMILDTKIHRKGIGKKLIEKAKRNNNTLNGWVVISSSYSKNDGTNYKSPLEFYKKVGFFICKNEIFETDVLKTIKIQWKAKEKC